MSTDNENKSNGHIGQKRKTLALDKKKVVRMPGRLSVHLCRLFINNPPIVASVHDEVVIQQMSFSIL